MKRCHLVLSLCVFSAFSGFSQGVRDSVSHLDVKNAKHYFMSTIFLNYFSNPQSAILPDKVRPFPLDNRFQTYDFSEVNLGYYVPLITKDYHRDSITISNFNILTTGSVVISSPHFNGLPNHQLYKISLGLRGIYNNGKNDIFFADLTPFLAQDSKSTQDPTIRFASTWLWDHMVGENFSFRLGITRTYIFGNRYILPYIGARFGRLDGVNLSVQFPRNISLNFNMGSHFRGSVYIKPLGGLYSFANSDTLYTGADQSIEFGQWSMLNGLRLDYNPCRNFSFFLSTGITQFNHISFSSVSYNANNRFVLEPFYITRVKPTSFINLGMTVRFGKVKQSYNNRNLYEMFDLNNTIDPGDTNSGAGNGNIPSPPGKNSLKRIKYKDIEDLIETQDLY